MASLPSNTFICNYNARDYVAATRTLPKTEGQSLNQDLTFGAATVTADTENGYLTINNNKINLNFNSAADNPFNRYNNETGRSLTIIYKTSSFSNTLFGNRGRNDAGSGDNYNYMVRDTIFHTSDSNFLRMTASTSPYIMYVRINADGTSERKCVTTGQIVTASSISYGNAPKNCSFFNGGANITETYAGNFYWIYISAEVLTDAEIQQVIKYNEKTSFETDITAITATYNSTTCAVTLTADEEMAWTASTSNDWITLSTTGGTGSSVFTVSVAANKAYAARNGLVTITNGENVIEITVEQAKYPLLIPNENIYRADLEVVKGYRSGSTINKAYRSGELIYYKLNYSEPTPVTPATPLTFNITSDGTILWKTSDSSFNRTIQYSKDGSNWTSITSSSSGTPITVIAGDNVEFRGDNSRYGGGQGRICTFSGSTAEFSVYGNIMSLCDSTDFSGMTSFTGYDSIFDRLFLGCTGLTNATKLILPVSSLVDACCYGMFSGCTNLTQAPELPATTLAIDCYAHMFEGCTSLISTPKLSATTVGLSSYAFMFKNCTNISRAEISASTLMDYSCQYMFGGCSNLNYIKCLATDISANNCTNDWVNGVAGTGTFVTPSSTNWTTDTSGIPTGWTRVNA